MCPVTASVQPPFFGAILWGQGAENKEIVVDSLPRGCEMGMNLIK